MTQPELFVVTGPNVAGKSSFIRSRINDFSEFEIIMTDVYKSRTSEVFTNSIKSNKSIMTLKGLEIDTYKRNGYSFVQAFAKYAFSKDKLSREAFDTIVKNLDFKMDNPI